MLAKWTSELHWNRVANEQFIMLAATYFVAIYFWEPRLIQYCSFTSTNVRRSTEKFPITFAEHRVTLSSYLLACVDCKKRCWRPNMFDLFTYVHRFIIKLLCNSDNLLCNTAAFWLLRAQNSSYSFTWSRINVTLCNFVV